MVLDRKLQSLALLALSIMDTRTIPAADDQQGSLLPTFARCSEACARLAAAASHGRIASPRTSRTDLAAPRSYARRRQLDRSGKQRLVPSGWMACNVCRRPRTRFDRDLYGCLRRRTPDGPGSPSFLIQSSAIARSGWALSSILLSPAAPLPPCASAARASVPPGCRCAEIRSVPHRGASQLASDQSVHADRLRSSEQTVTLP